ncbi:hypothetical protein DdX_12768 [Ditylenchus destructor]|uniref:Uncharacterized protein n=1 Tax=Ditylenchus destructor TaxID=166010 RepID=A0AAD4QX09_9BILA|nr:hypothetical protein DdX_12768 [Ditylenchus destructor]
MRFDPLFVPGPSMVDTRRKSSIFTGEFTPLRGEIHLERAQRQIGRVDGPRLRRDRQLGACTASDWQIIEDELTAAPSARPSTWSVHSVRLQIIEDELTALGACTASDWQIIEDELTGRAFGATVNLERAQRQIGSSSLRAYADNLCASLNY